MAKLVIANWKMNGDKCFMKTYLTQVYQSTYVNVPEVALAVPAIYLATINTEGALFALAGQDVSRFGELGAYTGDTHVTMLADFNVKYCIIGHSERRINYAETNEIVLAKLNSLNNSQISSPIVPILCVGENKQCRDKGDYLDFISNQLSILTKVNSPVCQLVIAYEPIWAIGTGLVPTLADIQEVLQSIRSFVKSTLANCKVKLLYGGSVKRLNIQEIISLSEVDGVLVGGACLDFAQFEEICRVASQY